MSCRHHLLLEVNDENGSLRLNVEQGRLEKRSITPGKNVGYFSRWSEVAIERLFEMDETCSLDVADRVKRQGGHGADDVEVLRYIGELLGMTREGARSELASAQKKTKSEFGGDPR